MDNKDDLMLNETELEVIVIDDKYALEENPTYKDNDIRKLQNTDEANAESTFNPLILRILNNIRALFKASNEKSNLNLLINGDFSQWQRGEVIIHPGTNVYTADRWMCGSNVAAPVVKKYNSGGMWFQFSADKPDAFLAVTQTLEDSVFKKVEGKFVTFSYSIDAKTTTSTYLCTSPRTPTIKLPVNKVLNWAKLELGSVATPYIPPDPAVNLMQCQRYYRDFTSFITTVRTNFLTNIYIDFKVNFIEMRVAPTIKVYAPVTDTINAVRLSNGTTRIDNTPIDVGFTVSTSDSINISVFCPTTMQITDTFNMDVRVVLDAEIY